MAVGRQDYQAGVVPIKSGYSLVQTQYFDWSNLPIVAGATGDFCEYTVGAGYELHVQGYRIFCDVPFINLMYIRINGAQYLGREFDMELNDNFPEGATLVVVGGDTFKIQVKNQDTVTTNVQVLVYGYLEQVET